jgi:hypothetical protein
LEIGPGNGDLAAAVLGKYGNRIAGYFGLERDQNVQGGYERIVAIEPGLRIDVLVASEVIEHMPADTFYDEILMPASRQMSAEGVAIIGTPNALAPGSIFRDFTHVQGYAWYDLYAIARTLFERVDVYRTRYLWSPQRLVWLLPNIIVSRALELDWCDGLVLLAQGPRSRAIAQATRTFTSVS